MIEVDRIDDILVASVEEELPPPEKLDWRWILIPAGGLVGLIVVKIATRPRAS